MAYIQGSFARVDSAGDAVPTNGATVKLWPDNATFQAAVGTYPPQKGTAIPDAGTMLPTDSTTTASTAGGIGSYRFSGVTDGAWWVSIEYSGDDTVWEYHQAVEDTSTHSLKPAASDDIMYVSFANGLDANDGLSWGSAKKTIAAAVTALGSAGGVIELAPGSHTLSAAVAISATNDLTIRGAGYNKTLVTVGGNYSAFEFTGLCSRIKLQDMWIGSFAARASGYGVSIVGSSGTHSSEITLDNVTIQNVHTPLYFRYCDRVTVKNIIVINSIAAAVDGMCLRFLDCLGGDVSNVVVYSTSGDFGDDIICMDSNTDSFTFNNCQVTNATGHGFLFQNSLGGGSDTGPRLTKLHNCFAESCTGDGFNVAAARDLRMTNCHAAVNASDGFHVAAGDSVVMDGCLATNNDQHGFNIAGGEGVGILGCTASNNSLDTVATYDGVYIAAGVTNCRVIGNRLGDFIYSVAVGGDQQYGINIAAGASDYLTVFGNDTQNNVTAGIVNGATGTNNFIQDAQTFYTNTDFTGAVDLNSNTLGLRIVASGANRVHGSSSLAAGVTSTTVTNTAVKTGAVILFMAKGADFYARDPYVSAITDVTSFVITHTNTATTADFEYIIINPVA